jgi:hypothetical protein
MGRGPSAPALSMGAIYRVTEGKGKAGQLAPVAQALLICTENAGY